MRVYCVHDTEAWCAPDPGTGCWSWTGREADLSLLSGEAITLKVQRPDVQGEVIDNGWIRLDGVRP
jgi:hypothetical protein